MPIPNFPKKFDQKVIITPRQHLLAEEGELESFHVPESVIFCFEEYVMDHVQTQHAVESGKFWTCDIHYFKDSDKRVAIVGNFGIGGPASCHLLEILIAAGVQRFIVIGHAGGLQKTNPIGTIVLCDKAVRDEGLSYHYLEDSTFAYPSKQLSQSLFEALNKQKLRCKIGSTWTLDSMYRETLNEVRHYEKEGIDTVEMEAASMFAVATFRKVQIAAMFVISDLVSFDEWEEQLHGGDTSKALLDSLLVAKHVLGQTE